MQPEGTSAANPPLRIALGGVLIVEGFGAALRVDGSHLMVRSGTGRRVAEGTFARITKPRLRRVVVIAGPAGYLTIPAVRWIRDVGADLVALAPDGEVLLAPGRMSPDDARLRRQQALAASSDLGLAISRRLIEAKIAGQRRVVAQRFGDGPARFAKSLDRLAKEAEQARSIEELRQTEALASTVYFTAWKDRVRIRWARKDEGRVAQHWKAFSGRGSPLANGPRMAGDPINALVNLASALLEVETVLALRTVGLDPGIAFGLHADRPNRSSAADDVMEPARPAAEELVLGFIADRVFPRRDFAEGTSGHVRVMPELSGSLVEAWIPEVARAVAPWAELVASMIGKAAGIKGLPTNLTESNRSAGRDSHRKAPRQARTRERVAERMVSRKCVECGTVLSGRGIHCPDCLLTVRSEEFERARTKATATLKSLRREGSDPSHGGRAASKRARTLARHQEEAKAFESASGDLPPHEVFVREILPTLRSVSIRAMAEATGLTRSYCSMIRRGLRVPHPRHWEGLRRLEPRRQCGPSEDPAKRSS